MCRQIPAEFLLANYFRRYPQKPITYAHLRKLRSELEAAIQDLVFVDISGSSVLSAVEQYPEMFEWDGSAVRMTEGSEEFFSEDYIDSRFNSEVDKSIRQTALRVLRVQ